MMIDLTLKDGTTYSFERLEVSADPVEVGKRIDPGRGAYTWQVEACLPRADGGYWIGLSAAVVHVTNIHGERKA